MSSSFLPVVHPVSLLPPCQWEWARISHTVASSCPSLTYCCESYSTSARKGDNPDSLGLRRPYHNVIRWPGMHIVGHIPGIEHVLTSLRVKYLVSFNDLMANSKLFAWISYKVIGNKAPSLLQVTDNILIWISGNRWMTMRQNAVYHHL